MDIKQKECVTILGGSENPRSMGKACTLVDIQTRDKKYFYRLMIDCGTEFRQEPQDGESENGHSNDSINPDFSKIGKHKVDAVLLSHLHADHTGAVGEMIDVNYNHTLGKVEISGPLKPEAPIISSPQTAYGLEHTLRDRKNQTFIQSFDILRRRMIVPQPGVCEILPGLPVFWQQNGHLSGSSSIAIPTGSGGVGLITGDMCQEDTPITKGWQLPSETFPSEWIPDQIWNTDLTPTDCDESGLKPPLSGEVTKFQNQARADLLNGKKIIVASFRTGRGQNLPMWLLPVAKELGIPIRLDGSIPKIYRTFQNHRWSERDGILPEIGENSGIMEVRDSMHRQALLEKDGPAIFITTSGMGNFGPIVQCMKFGLARKDFSFYFTSWLASGSNGDRLIRAYEKAVELRKQHPLRVAWAKINDPREGTVVIPLVADIYHFRLGGHGGLGQFVEFVDDIVMKCRKGRPLKRIILTHGSFKSLHDGAKALRNFTEEMYFGNEDTVIYV